MKFFGVLQLTCDSVKIIQGSEARKQVTTMLQMALLPPRPLADQGLKQPTKSLLSFPLLSGKTSIASHNVSCQDLGCT